MKGKNAEYIPNSALKKFAEEFGAEYIEYAESILFRKLCAAFDSENWDEAYKIECHLSKLGII